MTVYKAIRPEAEAAAQLAYELLSNPKGATSQLTQGKTVQNGKIAVPSVLLTPIAVTKQNIKDTVVKDQFYTVAQVCTADLATQCKEAGLQ